MSKIIAALIFVACAVLAFTNPNEKKHKDVVYQELSKEAGMGGFVGELAGSLAEKADVLPFTYKNYLLFSTMSFRDEIVSVGLFNYVQATDWDPKQAVEMTES